MSRIPLGSTLTSIVPHLGDAALQHVDLDGTRHLLDVLGLLRWVVDEEAGAEVVPRQVALCLRGRVDLRT
jgi:hypothetical protein